MVAKGITLKKDIFMYEKKLAFISLLSVISITAHVTHPWQEAYPIASPWRYIDFDVSMRTHAYEQSVAVTRQITEYGGSEFLDCVRSLYKKNNLSVIAPHDTVTIPKDMHQIWLGGKLPDVFLPLIESWKENHKSRGWRHFLWVDDSASYQYGDVVITKEAELKRILELPASETPASIVVDVCAITLDNQELYDQVDNYGVKSDLLKWEIIYRYGGVYIDTDFECLRPLDILHYTYDFYTGMQPLDTLLVQLGAALFAGHPKHPILKHCIATIKDDWHYNGAPKKSGPVHFSKSFLATAGKDNSKDIALPAHYLYPLGCRDKISEERREGEYRMWVNNGSYAVHHWAKSWMPLRYRPMQFRTINNEQSSQSWND